MKQSFLVLLVLGFALALSPARGAGHKPERIAVGYFQQWPAPALFALEKKTFDKSLGLAVDWLPYADGAAMRAALAAGEIQIAYSLGYVPFLVGASIGIDLEMIGVAVDYSATDNCILRRDAGIGPDNAGALAGQRVAVRRGSISHFRLNRVLERLDVDPGAVDIVDAASGADAAAALRRGEVVMACASGSGLRAMAGLGQPLMSADEQAAAGLRVFDTVAASGAFVEEHADVVQDFMDVLEAANEQWRLNPDAMRPAIARAANMSLAAADRALADFRFPGAAEQKSADWLGARLVDYSKEVADFFVAQGRLGRALDNYDAHITTRFLR